MRARSLLPLLGRRWAAVRRSAAWVHGAVLTEPASHHVQRAVPTRIRAHSHARTVFHDLRLDPADVREVAGVCVSTPERTLADLARSEHQDDVDLACSWALADEGVQRAAVAWLRDHPRFPRARAAVAVLSQADTR